LAQQIAEDTTAHAAVVGSGRVGRTELLTLKDKPRWPPARTFGTDTPATWI
jgi:hypothetical protein